MGVLIAFAAIAPFLGAAAVLDRRSKRRRRDSRPLADGHTVPTRRVDLGLDIGREP